MLRLSRVVTCTDFVALAVKCLGHEYPGWLNGHACSNAHAGPDAALAYNGLHARPCPYSCGQHQSSVYITRTQSLEIDVKFPKISGRFLQISRANGLVSKNRFPVSSKSLEIIFGFLEIMFGFLKILSDIYAVLDDWLVFTQHTSGAHGRFQQRSAS